MPQKSYNKPSLPPLSSLLKDQNYKLPSIDTFSQGHSPMPTPITSASTPIPMMAQPPQNHVVGPSPVTGQFPHTVANNGSARSLSVPTSRASSTSSSNGGSPTTPEFKKSKKLDKSFAFISHSVKTFPSQEPSIDNAPLARRKRRRTSPNELNILNQEFLLGSTPNKLRRVEIAHKVSMTEKAVQIWFQNKRQSLRKQGGGDREITELPPTPDVNNMSMNSSFNSSVNNSMNNSAINLNTSMTSMNTSVISSTPMKPMLNKSQSFTSPETTKFESPIKQRSSSTTSIFSKPILTSKPSNGNIPTTSHNVISASTPDSSFVDDSDTSMVLNENKKRLMVPNASSMTFKLGKFKVHNDNKENLPVKVKTEGNKIQHLLNNAADETRKPLAELNGNRPASSATKPRVNEGVQNLLSLREGNWR